MEAIVRPDIRRVDENVHKSAKDILIDKGIIRDPTKPTVLLDQFTGTQPLPKAEEPEEKLPEKVTVDTQTDQPFLNAFDGEPVIDRRTSVQSMQSLSELKFKDGFQRQQSMFSEGVQKDVLGLLAEMNKKIEQITDRAESVNDNRTGRAALSPNSSGAAPPGARKSPEFNKTGD